MWGTQIVCLRGNRRSLHYGRDDKSFPIQHTEFADGCTTATRDGRGWWRCGDCSGGCGADTGTAQAAVANDAAGAGAGGEGCSSHHSATKRAAGCGCVQARESDEGGGNSGDLDGAGADAAGGRPLFVVTDNFWGFENPTSQVRDVGHPDCLSPGKPQVPPLRSG